MASSNKLIIYQVFTRLYGNRNTTRKEYGTIEENGCGKLNDFTPTTLKHIREMGVSHIWYTGVIRHATMTDYSAYGIPRVGQARLTPSPTTTTLIPIWPPMSVNACRNSRLWWSALIRQA